MQLDAVRRPNVATCNPSIASKISDADGSYNKRIRRFPAGAFRHCSKPSPYLTPLQLETRFGEKLLGIYIGGISGL